MYDAQLARTVARKVMRPNSVRERRFAMREARLTAHLDHPGVVAVYDLEVGDDGTIAYTMAEIRGEPMDAVLARCDGLASRLRLLPAFRSVCETLAYAHSEGVIHRDLKPANLMIGAFGRVMVVDWGLGRAVDDESTQLGRIVGTPSYMAPEQARGHAVDARADVWGLGAILYELLTGGPPFREDDLAAVLRAVAAGVVVRADRIEPDAPRELVDIASKALQSRPEDRYPDASALLRDIDAFLEGRFVGAHAYSATELVRRAAWRFRWGVLGLMAFGGVVLVAAAVAVSGLVAGRVQAMQERNRAWEALADALEADAVQALGEGRIADAGLAASTALELSPDRARARSVLALGDDLRAMRLVTTLPGEACNNLQRLAGGLHVAMCGDRIEVRRDRDGAIVDQREVGPAGGLVAGDGWLAVLRTPHTLLVDVDASGHLGDSRVAEVGGADRGLVPEGDVLWSLQASGTGARIDRIDVHTGEFTSRQLDAPFVGGVDGYAVRDGTVWMASSGGSVRCDLASGRCAEPESRLARVRKIALVGDDRFELTSDGDLFWVRPDGMLRYEIPGFGEIVDLVAVSERRVVALGTADQVAMLDLVQRSLVRISVPGVRARGATELDGDLLVWGARQSQVWRIAPLVNDHPLPDGVSSCADRDGRVACGSVGVVGTYDPDHGFRTVAAPWSGLVKDLDLTESGMVLVGMDDRGIAEMGPSGVVQHEIGPVRYRRVAVLADEVLVSPYSYPVQALGPDGPIAATLPAADYLEPSGDRRRFVTVRNDTISVWEGRTSIVERTPGNRVRAVALDADGTRLAFATDEPAVWVQDLRIGTQARVPIEVDRALTVLAFSPQGRYLAMGDWNGGITVLRLEDLGVVFDATAHGRRVGGIGWVDEEVFVSGGWDRRMRRWDLRAASADPTEVREALEQALGRALPR